MRSASMAFLMAAGVSLAGCAGATRASADHAAHGSTRSYVQDRPRDAPRDEFAQIHVVFTAVDVHAAAPLASDHFLRDEHASAPGRGNHGATLARPTTGAGAATAAAGDAGWQRIFTGEAVDVDLLNAPSTAAAFLGEAELAVGTYTDLRIHVAAAYGIDHAGGRVDFQVPSGKVRFHAPFQVDSAMATRIVLDIDLEATLLRQRDAWLLQPFLGKAEVLARDGGASGAGVHERGQIVEVET